MPNKTIDYSSHKLSLLLERIEVRGFKKAQTVTVHSILALLGMVCFVSVPVWADQTKQCLAVATTQMEMNRCAGVGFDTADSQLNSVYKKIQDLYKNDPVFLEKLKASQLAWLKLKEADIQLQYPHSAESGYYGSVLPMCVSDYETQLTLQRAEFLKRWLKGAEEGDVCQGSIMNDQKLKELLKK